MLNLRLERIISTFGLTIQEFAKTLMISDGTIRGIIKNRVTIQGPLLLAIQLKYNINPDWLLTGQGPMFLPPSQDGGYTPPPDSTARLKGKDKETVTELIEYLGDKPRFKEYKQQELDFKAWQKEKQEKQIKPKPVVDIKAIEEKAKFPYGRFADVALYLGRVAAGHPSEIFDEEIKEYIKVDLRLIKRETPNPKELFCLEVKSDSMAGAGIMEEDLCVFKPVYTHGEIKHKDIVLARIEGALTLKRFMKNVKPNILRAENPKYPDIELKTEEHVILAKWLLVIGQTR